MSSPLQLRPKRRWGLYLKLGIVGALLLAATISGICASLYLFEAGDIPDVAQLDDHRPSVITRVTSAQDDVLAEFASERRIIVGFRDIPEALRYAIIAVEDADFFDHHGLNLRGIMRAAVENAREGRVVEGGSSLTQQLAKLMFLTPERSLRRKFKEAVLALHLERTYSKEEILAFYCNEIYLGHNRYGVEAGARFYFGKHAQELSLPEAALIAGLPQRPNAYSPYRDQEASKRRRDHVLSRMEAAGFITAEAAADARQAPIVLAPFEPIRATTAPYFVEQVRQQLEQKFGEKSLYHEGLSVATTLDVRLQRAAEKALRDGLMALDQRRGWRRATHNVMRDEPGADPGSWQHPSWPLATIAIGDLLHGVVTSVRAGAVTVRVDRLTATITESPRWTGRARVAELFEIGDIGLFRVAFYDQAESTLRMVVEQEPEIEGALVALEVKTGKVVALVGGWDFERSRFDRAVQAHRQTGSAFKPLLYVAALENGFTAADTLFDEPIAISDASTGAVYSPENYSKNYYGLTTVREALEKSRNPVSVQLLQRIGAHTAIDTARRLGLTAELHPYPSLALGAFEVTLLEMTTAYASFADLGIVHDPYLIERISDRDSHTLYERHPVSRQAVSPEAAYIMTSMMQGVIDDGTARKAKSLGPSVAGKTGTTDDFTDAWFIGYSPTIACGVWVGYDLKRSLGKGEVGAVAALPIWIDFMAEAIAGRGDETYVKPPGVQFVSIDKRTGLRSSEFCEQPFQEVFLRGTAPATYCSHRDHEVRALPYYLQKLYLAGGSLPPLASTDEALSPTATTPEGAAQ